MSDEPVIVERRGHITLLTLNRPKERNSISPEIISGLTAACREIQDDMSVRCVILTGAGTAFSAGGNIKNMRNRTGSFGHATVATPQAYTDGIQTIPRLFVNLDVPVIAAVNGPAIGAGLDFALMCDIRIAADNAVFAESFIRVGLIPGDGGAWLLPRAIGMAKAMELALTARQVDAAEAEKIGIVSTITPPGALLDKAFELAGAIAQHSPRALRMTKKLFRLCEGKDLDSSLEIAAHMQAVLQSGADQLEAVTALLEKRDPHFSGQ